MTPNEFEEEFEGASRGRPNNSQPGFSYSNEFYPGNWNDSRISIEETPYQVAQQQPNQIPSPPLPLLAPVRSDLRNENPNSIRSVKSIETVAEVDIKFVINLKTPPKSAILTGSVIIILLSREDRVSVSDHSLLTSIHLSFSLLYDIVRFQSMSPGRLL
jgi:hypothetical protein